MSKLNLSKGVVATVEEEPGRTIGGLLGAFLAPALYMLALGALGHQLTTLPHAAREFLMHLSYWNVWLISFVAKMFTRVGITKWVVKSRMSIFS